MDKMHFDGDFGGLIWLARAAAWFWLGVYVLIPPAMLVSDPSNSEAIGGLTPAAISLSATN